MRCCPTATKHSRGGGLCLFHRDTIKVKLQKYISYGSFECQLVKLIISRSKSSDVINMAVIYRPPTTAENPAAVFYDEISGLFDKFSDIIDGDQFVCCGDFNCGGDDPTSVSSDLQAMFDARRLHQSSRMPFQTMTSLHGFCQRSRH